MNEGAMLWALNFAGSEGGGELAGELEKLRSGVLANGRDSEQA